MAKEKRVIYSLSDIVGLRVPCPECGKENSMPLDYDPNPTGTRTVGLMCPHCLGYNVGAVCAELATLIWRFKALATARPLVNEVRLEFNDDPA